MNYKVSDEAYLSSKGLRAMQSMYEKLTEVLGTTVPACEAPIVEYANFGKNKWYTGFCDKIPEKHKDSCEKR